MKVSVFVNDYLPFLETKDPGQIIFGLKELGVETELLTHRQDAIADYHPDFNVMQASWDEFNSESFWQNYPADAIVAYTWLNDLFLPLLSKIKSSGKKILIKVDSDGHLGYPLSPSPLRVPFLEIRTLRNFAGRLWWGLPCNYLHARRSEEVAKQRIKQIDLVDKVIIESPDALSNLNLYLTTWGRQDLTKKTCFVPDPVTPDFVDGAIGKKQNIVAASFGRPEAYQQKNSAGIVQTMARFLKARREYKAIVFGGSQGKVESEIRSLPKDVADRFNFLGYVERERINQILSTAKIFLMPSRWESFGIAAAEALCMGCSVTVTPVESLRYLTIQGFSGTVSSDFSNKEVLATLLHDAEKWEKGSYLPEKIAEFWRGTLNRKQVAKNILTIL
jgi:glycosyltransferase involved in cell wall biosynthesis